MAGEVFFDIAVDAVVTQPADGVVTNGVKDVVTVKVGEDLDASLVSLSANASATLVSTPKYTASGISRVLSSQLLLQNLVELSTSVMMATGCTLPLKDPAVNSLT